MTFVIVCGGTAGHINPGLSIAGELRARCPEAKILFIGAGRELEKRLIPEAGYELINLKTRGIRRGFRPGDIKHNFLAIIYAVRARAEAGSIMAREMPAAVVGTGGYVCYPALKAAISRKIPVFVHESNAKPGITIALLSRHADKVMVTYPGFEDYYKHPQRVVVTGTPVRSGFYGGSGSEAEHVERPRVVSFWGSLGALKMNRHMAGFIKRNMEERSFEHIHAAGGSMDVLSDEYKKLGGPEFKKPYADVREYIDDMPDVMKSADLIISRAGAATLSEITFLGKPSILVPSPYVPDDVQLVNAKQLEAAGAAIVLKEDECDAGLLYETACKLLNDRDKLKKMSVAAKKLSYPDAAADIAGIILAGIK